MTANGSIHSRYCLVQSKLFCRPPVLRAAPERLPFARFLQFSGQSGDGLRGFLRNTVRKVHFETSSCEHDGDACIHLHEKHTVDLGPSDSPCAALTTTLLRCKNYNRVRLKRHPSSFTRTSLRRLHFSLPMMLRWLHEHPLLSHSMCVREYDAVCTVRACVWTFECARSCACMCLVQCVRMGVWEGEGGGARLLRPQGAPLSFSRAPCPL